MFVCPGSKLVTSPWNTEEIRLFAFARLRRIGYGVKKGNVECGMSGVRRSMMKSRAGEPHSKRRAWKARALWCFLCSYVDEKVCEAGCQVKCVWWSRGTRYLIKGYLRI